MLPNNAIERQASKRAHLRARGRYVIRSHTAASGTDEQRFVTLGLLQGIPVSILHTERKGRIHVISFRKATRREKAILIENL